MLDIFIDTMKLTRDSTLKLVADLSDDQIVLQPVAGMNHPAWVLGHLLMVDGTFLVLAGGAKPALATDWMEIYGRGSIPVADKTKYKPKNWYLDQMASVRNQVIERLKVLTPADMAQPHPDPARRERFPTVGHNLFAYGTWHEAYHAGQLSAWRRVLGLPAA